jgi:hypothetical protein
MFRPFATYRDAAGRARVGWRALVVGPAVVAAVIGAFVTLSNSGEMLPTLWLGSALTWAWAPLLQMVVVTPIVLLGRAAGARRELRLSSGIDLFFLGHAPWSLWLLVVGAALALRLPQLNLAEVMPLLRTAIIPIAWTMLLLFAFFRSALGLRWWLAALLTIAYQAVLWACVYLYVGAATYRLPPFAPAYAGFLG